MDLFFDWQTNLSEHSINYMDHSQSTPSEWDAQIKANNGHLLQSWAWGEFKSEFGWQPYRFQLGGAMAQILFRQLPLGWTIAYIPKGPVIRLDDFQQWQVVLKEIHAVANAHRAIFLKIEPDVWQLGRQATAQSKDITAKLATLGFKPADTIQPQTSQVLHIDEEDDVILGQMKQKTRYNIRLAKRKGVEIREGTFEDVETFHNLSLVTGERDKFGIHSLPYYQRAFELFAPDRCALLLAEYEGEPLAALMVFCQGQEAYYFYGASSNQHRNRMPTYLLQWTAIEWTKEKGCHRYDLWGIPDADPATLEAEFQNRNDGLWGVYRFKRGFGGDIVQSVGAFDYVYNPLLYRLYKMRRSL